MTILLVRASQDMYPPGLRLLRKAREKLGLTYREVEKASYELALKRGRPDFILHLSRLADIENRGVVPSLHKLYSMATIYHVDPIKMASWCEAPLQQTFRTDCYSLRRKQIGARHHCRPFRRTRNLSSRSWQLRDFCAKCQKAWKCSCQRSHEIRANIVAATLD